MATPIVMRMAIDQPQPTISDQATFSASRHFLRQINSTRNTPTGAATKPAIGVNIQLTTKLTT